MRRMFVSQGRLPGLADLASRQCGVVTRVQLCGLGATHKLITAQVNAGRWSAVTSSVVLLHNHEPNRDQWMWIAVLDAQPVSALACHSALESAGFHGFAREAKPVHIVVPRGAKTTPLPKIVVHESRRFDLDDVREYRGIPCTEVHRSAVDAGAWQPWPRFAVSMMASVVQQRVCQVSRLHAALDEAGHVRHRKAMRLALFDIEGGAQAMSEIDAARMCRRFGLAPPHRQRRRRDRSGRVRYLDCEWDLGDGTVVVLEIDGSHHREAVHWDADIKRQRKIVTRSRHVLRATATEARYEQEDIAVDLIALGVPILATHRVRTQLPPRATGF